MNSFPFWKRNVIFMGILDKNLIRREQSWFFVLKLALGITLRLVCVPNHSQIHFCHWWSHVFFFFFFFNTRLHNSWRVTVLSILFLGFSIGWWCCRHEHVSPQRYRSIVCFATFHFAFHFVFHFAFHSALHFGFHFAFYSHLQSLLLHMYFSVGVVWAVAQQCRCCDLDSRCDFINRWSYQPTWVM